MSLVQRPVGTGLPRSFLTMTSSQPGYLCMDGGCQYVYALSVWMETDIMLSIRDEEVRTLAEAVMKRCGAPNLTAAIKLALQREIKRADEALP